MYVANTPADTVDVIDPASHAVVARVPVGVPPVALAARPDGKEVWVANHVSDSVSVIDADPASPTRFQVLATVQDLDPARRATRFDEPVGVALAGDAKAYVALSSQNQVAVVDVAARKVVKHLDVPAQDPRAIAVRGGRLYVLPFESGNRTQLSGGSEAKIDGDLVTFDAWEHSVRNRVLVDGLRVGGSARAGGETLTVELEATPPVGTHFLQLQNPDGLVSNDFIFHVAADETSARALRQPRLGEVLREAKWDGLIGTWVDEATGGKPFRTTYAWKIRDVLIESAHRDPSNESVALIGLDPATGAVFHSGSDRTGSKLAGTWAFAPDGDATLDLSYANTDAQTGTLKLRYRLKGDTLELRVGAPTAAPLKLTRAPTD